MAVQGIAFTLSIELALASDIVVAADDVRFRQLEVGRGILPFGGATLRAPAQLGWGNAMRWILTGEEFGAAEAQRIGLVQEVVAGRAAARAARRRDRAARRRAGAARRAGHAGQRPDRLPRRGAAAREHLRRAAPAAAGQSEDAAEGVLSFVERREARFTGR